MANTLRSTRADEGQKGKERKSSGLLHNFKKALETEKENGYTVKEIQLTAGDHWARAAKM